MTLISGLLKRYGPSGVKRLLWDEEFRTGKWDFIDDTSGDCVYAYLEKYAQKGGILDLGCGPGNTANELAMSAYGAYVGVDISECALDKARRRSQAMGRAQKNSFARADFLRYTATQHFDVILLRESMYHVPLGQVKPMLHRYSTCLTESGVFIVRMMTSAKARLKAVVDLIEREYDVVEKGYHGEAVPIVLVFRPREG